MKRLLKVLLGVATFAAASLAHAAITCTSVTSPGFSTAFTGTVPPTNVTQSSVTVTCNRNLAGDPLTLNYLVASNNGLSPAGTNNRAQFGANRLTYDVFRDAACSLPWRGGGNRISNTMTFGSNFLAVSQTTNFWGCILTSQIRPAGTYTDTVTMTVSVSGLTNTFPVNITTPATCAITTAPSTLTFTYTAFGAAQTASASFQPNCTLFLPYSMALDTTIGVASGLNYTLALSTSAAGGTHPLPSTGTGVPQTFFINGSMAAGQAGTCATGTCNATNVHTLTITY